MIVLTPQLSSTSRNRWWWRGRLTKPYNSTWQWREVRWTKTTWKWWWLSRCIDSRDNRWIWRINRPMRCSWWDRWGLIALKKQSR
jgi:hypothetical protein